MRKLATRLAICASFATLAPTIGWASDTPRVIVTIKPVHALVAGVMEGVAEPELLMSGGTSPHAYALRPSQAASLAKAELVVRVSATLETFLDRSIANLATKAHLLTLDQTDGLTLHDVREGGLWEEDDHDGHKGYKHHDTHKDHHAHKDHDGHKDHDRHKDHDGHDHGEHDPHIWLDPGNAGKLVGQIAATLSRAWPHHGDAFAANARALRSRIDALDAELAPAMKPLTGKPYIVFHDAYHYFESRYGLTPAGAVTVSPDRMPGARRLSKLRRRIKDSGALCVFAEPQFEPRLVTTLLEGTAARRGVLDPLGASIAPGPDHYFELMRQLAANLTACMAPQ